MTMSKAVLLIAAAGVGLLGGLTLVPVDTAEAVVVCRARASGEGTGRGAADQRTSNARAAAFAQWARNVEARLGRRFANPSMARSVRFDCRPGVLQAKCAVSAVPCADIPRATKAKAKAKAKRKQKARR